MGALYISLKMLVCAIAAFFVLASILQMGRRGASAYPLKLLGFLFASFLFTWTFKAKRAAPIASLLLTVTMIPGLALERRDLSRVPPDLSQYGNESPERVLEEIGTDLPAGLSFDQSEMRDVLRRSTELYILMLLFQSAAVAFLYYRSALR